jgi:hypothetical protein
MKMEHTECSETSAYKIQTPGNFPEERIRNSERGDSLKSRPKPMFTRNSSIIFFRNLQNRKESRDLNVKDESQTFSLTRGTVLEEQLQPVVQTACFTAV